MTGRWIAMTVIGVAWIVVSALVHSYSHGLATLIAIVSANVWLVGGILADAIEKRS